MFILIILSTVLSILNAELTEPPPIKFTIETNQPIGTFIGSIKDHSSTHVMQPPYYIVPIQPDNQDLFNKDITIDLDTGVILSNSILNADELNVYKFTALSINEGLANLVIINIVNKNQPEPNVTIIEETRCLNLTTNTIVKLDSNDSFQLISNESNVTCNSDDWTGVLLIECNNKNTNLVYLDRNSIETFKWNINNIRNNKFEIKSEISNRTAIISFECNNNKFDFILNQSDDSDLQFVTIDKYDRDLILNNYLTLNNQSKIVVLLKKISVFDNCSTQLVLNETSHNEAANISLVINDISVNNDETTTLNSISKIEKFNLKVKMCLTILFASILVLLALIFSLFIWYKRNDLFGIREVQKSSNSIDQPNVQKSSSSSNLTYKTQTSTINSKFAEEEEEGATNKNYFNMLISQFHKNNSKNSKFNSLNRDHGQTTIKSFNSSHSNLMSQNQNKQDNDGLFTYSNGYLAEIGINMMENLNCLNQTRHIHSFDTLIKNDFVQIPSATKGFTLWSQENNQLLTRINSDDESFQTWCNLLGWKPEYNDISCVLNDLVLLKDLPS